MANRESDVEKHLHKLITAAGGTTRKWVSPNYVGVPDRIVIYKGHVRFAEVKTQVGKLSSMQEREIKRLRDHGAVVDVVFGKKGAELYVEKLIAEIDDDN